VAKGSAPQRFGKCLIEREIGRGARSVVYLAWHEGLQIPVAVKVMKRSKAEDDELFSERFMREARIAAQLTHTNMVRVYDCGERGDSYYLVLEYIEGESCKDRMSRAGAFDWQTAVRIVRAVADGLRYASTKGIIHRDLKPENIMIDREGAARVADMGLAKEVTKSQASATADGDVLGTPYYMSPEQVRQPGDVDFRSDIYSLGATLYHMVTGEVPFEAPTPFEIMTMHLNEPVAHPRTKKADLPTALCDVIMRMMAKEPQSRYQSYADLIRDLDSLFGEPGVGGPRTEFLEDGMELDWPEEERAAAPAAPEEAVRPAQRIQPGELPATAHNVRAKLFAVLAVLGYAFFGVCLYLSILGWAGSIAAVATVAAYIGGSAAWAYWLARGQGVAAAAEEAAAEEADAVDERLATALSRLCERVQLPIPRLLTSGRADSQCYSFGLFGGRALIRLPGRWLEETRLDPAETDVLLAQCLAGVYDGDADLRTLLAVPVTLLRVGGRVMRALGGLPLGRGLRARLRMERVTVLAGMAGTGGMLAVLFALSVPAGLLGLLVLGVLALVAAFERSSLYAADAFAAKVLDDPGAVESLVVLCGLTGWERCRLLYESIGPDVAERAMDQLPGPEDRRLLVESVAAHYGRSPHSPDTLSLARNLFSRQPSAAERLSRLVDAERSVALGAVAVARQAYSRLLGTADEQRPVSMATLAAVRPQVILGAVAGLIAVPVLAFVTLVCTARYVDFLIVLGALGAVLGIAVAHQSERDALSAAMLGWRMVVAAVCFACTAMIGFCLTGSPSFSHLALQFPLSLVPFLAAAAFGGGVFARWGPKTLPGAPLGHEDGSRTAHTLTMPLGGKESILRARSERKSAGEEGGRRR